MLRILFQDEIQEVVIYHTKILTLSLILSPFLFLPKLSSMSKTSRPVKQKYVNHFLQNENYVPVTGGSYIAV